MGNWYLTATTPVFDVIRALWRLARLLVVFAWGWWTVYWRFARMPPLAQRLFVKAWAQRMVGAMGIGLQVQGASLHGGPALLVANHVSWLDVLVLLAVGPCRFVAKAEVRAWPAIGRMGAAAGTLFIERESKRDVIRVVHHMAEALVAGDVVAVFPEGTTSDGQSVMPFHANLFQAAIASESPVQCVTLVYLDRQGTLRSPHVAYVGDDTLLASLWRTVKQPSLVVQLNLGPLMPTSGQSRRECAKACEQQVATQLAALLNPPMCSRP